MLSDLAAVLALVSKLAVFVNHIQGHLGKTKPSSVIPEKPYLIMSWHCFMVQKMSRMIAFMPEVIKLVQKQAVSFLSPYHDDVHVTL